MATLAISIDLSQMRQAQAQFQQLINEFPNMALKALDRIQAAFEKPLTFSGIRRSFDAFSNLMNKFLEVADTGMKLVKLAIEARPNLENYRKSVEEFRTIMKDYAKIAKGVAEEVNKSIGKALLKITPEIDLTKAIQSTDRFDQIMARYSNIVARNVFKMIRDWARLMQVVEDVNRRSSALATQLQANFAVLATMTPMFNQAAQAMQNMATSAQNMSANMKQSTSGMRFQSVGNVQAGGQVNFGSNAFNTRNAVRNLQSAQHATDNLHESMMRFRESMLGVFFLLDRFRIGRLVEDFQSFAAVLKETQLEMDRIGAMMRIGFKTPEQATIEMERARRAAVELGIEQNQAMLGYAKMAGATRDSAVQGQRTYQIWKAIAIVTAVTGDEAGLAIKAITDMVAKGKVSAEEIQKQLGQALPGSMRLAHEALAEQGKVWDDIRKGGVNYAKFVESIANLIIKRMGGEATEAVKRLGGTLNNLKNAWTDMLDQVNKGGYNQAYILLIQELTKFMREPETLAAMRNIGITLGEMIPKAIQYLIPFLKMLRDHLGGVVYVATTLAGIVSGFGAGGLLGMIAAPVFPAAPLILGLGGALMGGGATGLLGKWFQDEYNENLKKGQSEQQAEWFARNKVLGDFIEPGTDRPQKTQEEQDAENRFQSFQRTLNAQTQEYLSVVKLQEQYPILSDEYAIAAKESELLRKAEVERVDVNKELSDGTGTLLDLIKTSSALAVETEKQTRTLTALAQEEVKAKAGLTLETRLNNEILGENMTQIEAYIEFQRLKIEQDRVGIGLEGEKAEAAFNNIEAQIRANKALESSINLSKERTENAFKEAEALIKLAYAQRYAADIDERDWATGKVTMPGEAQALGGLPGFPLPEGVGMAGQLAVFQGRQRLLLQNPDAAAQTVFNPQLGIQESRITAQDRESLRSHRAEVSSSVSESVLNMQAEIQAQKDLLEVQHLSFAEREQEINARKAVQEQQKGGKVLTQDEILQLRETSIELTKLRQNVKDVYDGKKLSEGLRDLKDIGTTVFRHLGDALAEFVKKGKFDFSQFIKSLIADLTDLAVKRALIEPLDNFMKQAMTDMRAPGAKDKMKDQIQGSDWITSAVGWASSLLGAYFSGGGGGGGQSPGLVTSSGTTPFMGFPEYFGGVAGEDFGPRRYAFGGIAGVDTIPAWLSRGEGIFTKAQMQNLAPVERRRDKDVPPVIVTNNFSFPNSNADTFRRSTPQIEARMQNSSRRSAQRLRG